MGVGITHQYNCSGEILFRGVRRTRLVLINVLSQLYGTYTTDSSQVNTSNEDFDVQHVAC